MTLPPNDQGNDDTVAPGHERYVDQVGSLMRCTSDSAALLAASLSRMSDADLRLELRNIYTTIHRLRPIASGYREGLTQDELESTIARLRFKEQLEGMFSEALRLRGAGARRVVDRD